MPSNIGPIKLMFGSLPIELCGSDTYSWLFEIVTHWQIFYSFFFVFLPLCEIFYFLFPSLWIVLMLYDACCITFMVKVYDLWHFVK